MTHPPVSASQILAVQVSAWAAMPGTGCVPEGGSLDPSSWPHPLCSFSSNNLETVKADTRVVMCDQLKSGPQDKALPNVVSHSVETEE